MRAPTLLLPALLLAAAVAAPLPAAAQSAVVYTPAEGDIVLLFTHRLIPELYEEGRAVIVDGFGGAIDAHNDDTGHDRLTYFLEDRENAMILAISFFHADASVEDWLASPHRHEVLAALEPFVEEPVFIERLTTIDFHHTWNPHATGHEARGGSSHPRH